PVSGRVLVDGTDITRARSQARAARGLARTFQHPELFPGLTVRDHLVLAYRVRNARQRVWSDLFSMGSIHPVDQAEKDEVDALVDLLGLGPVAEHSAGGLPLGTARLVELGRALATSPRLLLLDEPSSGLTAAETAQFEATLTRIAADSGASILLVEHDVELVMRLCSAVNVLDFGELIAHGTPEEVRASPAVRAAYLGEEGPADPGGVDDAREEPAEPDEPAHPEDSAQPVSAAQSALPALRVDGLSVRYGDAVALTDVSFSLAGGRALAVLGLNGAGKSTLARVLSGLVPATSGRIELAGTVITNWPAYRIRRAGLLQLPEGRGVFRGLSVSDNLKMAASAAPDRASRDTAIDLALTTFPHLASRRRQLAGRLSGGEQQMLSLARALATTPQLLVADELSLGLAPKLVDLVFDSLERARGEGVTVVLIEQYVHRALAFADDCLILQRGEIAWHGPSAQAGGELLRGYLGAAMAAGT
ncbi:MAG TPA: ATP-binding cassette domain-containing protein, partial [Mycobacteriales bacterium]|nr:ATP-binding cassette domain-containing protein [Mycobacteriales bacterium]